MKLTLDNGVSITLTKEQLEEINKQQNKLFNFRDIKSFEDACNHLGIAVDNNLSNNGKLEVIIKAINNGWKPDFSNKNQAKYYPYLYVNNNGVSTYYYTDYNYSYRDLPLTLYLESSEKAEYMGKTFTHLYNEL